MFLSSSTMYAKQEQRRRDSKLLSLDDDTHTPDPEIYREIHLDIPNDCYIQPFPSPSPALLEFCSDCDIELLLPSPIDTPRRRESGNEEDADLGGLEDMKGTFWRTSDAIEDGEDGEAGKKTNKAISARWHDELYECGSKAEDGTNSTVTTIQVQPPTPEEQPEIPDEFESTSQCATPRAQSFIDLAALNKLPPQTAGAPGPVTSRYAPPRGGPKSPIASQSTTKSPTWTVDLVDRTKQEAVVVGDSITIPPLPPPNLTYDAEEHQASSTPSNRIVDGTVPPNSTPRDPIATPIQGQQKVDTNAIEGELARALRKAAVTRKQDAASPSPTVPDEFIGMAPATDIKGIN